MKKLLIAGFIVAAGLALITIALPLLISSDSVRASLLQRAKEITGREMVFHGDPGVAFSPFLGIEIQDVEFHSDSASGKPILTMPTLRGRLSIASALRGRVEIDEFQFIRPVFDISVGHSGKTSWAFPDGEVWQVLKEARRVREETETGDKPDISQVPDVKLGLFTVLDGLVNYRDERNGRVEVISNLNGRLSWPSTRVAWTFDGNGIWRGDTVEVDLETATPVMLLAGGQTAINAEIKSEPLTLTFKGEANRFADLFFAGELNATSPSLRRTINFLGGQVGSGSSYSDFAAAGMISGTFQDIQIQGAKLSLDGNTYSGSLRLSEAENGMNRLSGTLATEAIDASPYMLQISSVDGIKSLFDVFYGTEMDVRLSSKLVKLNDLAVTDFAGSLISRDDQFKIDVGNANVDEGIIIGALTASSSRETISVGGQINASGINPASLPVFKKLSGLRPNGISNLELSMSSNIDDNGEFLENLSGSLTLAMKNGVVNGLDFSQLRPSIDGEKNSLENIQMGDALEQTPVENFILNASIDQGIAWVGDSSFNVEEFKAHLSGKADLRSGNLALWGLMQKPDDEGTLRSHSQFFLGGTLTEPLYIPQFSANSPLPVEGDGDGDTEPAEEDGTN